ncbi:hypothetical protein Dimus_004070 [Dionaea muscipula]
MQQGFRGRAARALLETTKISLESGLINLLWKKLMSILALIHLEVDNNVLLGEIFKAFDYIFRLAKQAGRQHTRKPLEFLDLLDNQLTGTLTPNISLLNELTKLSIGRNRISGSILAKILCRKQQFYGRNTQRTGSAYLSGDSKSKLQQPLWRL